MFSLLQFLGAFLALFTLITAAPSRHGKNVQGIGSPISNPNAKNVIAGKYIVVYNDNATDAAVATHQASVMASMRKRGLNADMRHIAMGSFRSMSISSVDDGMVSDIANAASVSYVEQDQVMQSSALLSQSNATTGLARISHKAKGNSTYVFDSSAGAGIVAYVIDTGIMINHTEFQGRATFGTNLVNTVNTDENGHGSHVAGTIGGMTYGVAKSVSLVAVKVLDASGAGTNADVISGLQWAMTNATARNLTGKALINMSVGGSFSTALNTAIAKVTAAGITVIVAAGNDDVDASSDSPASAPSAITVGAIDQSTDKKASFSNFGASVDIMAPGVSVLSVGITSITATSVLSGTSMACPHMTGMAAYLMALEGLTTSAAIVARMKSLAGTTGATTKAQSANTTTLIGYNGDGF